MRPDHIMLVQSTWEEIEPMSAKIGEIFYRRLFQRAPELKPMFTSDEIQQGRVIMGMMGTAVNALMDIDNLTPAVEVLGKRHTGYNVQPEHFEPFKDALLGTLEEMLGSGWSADVKEAWEAVFAYLAKTMIGSMHPGG